MAIAAHIDDSPKSPSVLLQLLLKLAEQYPAEHFVLFVNKKQIKGLRLLPNCKAEPVIPPIKNYLLRYYWYQHKLPNLLEKHNVRYFLSEHNNCNLNLKTPQALFVKYLPPVAKKSKEKYISNCLDNAAAIFVSNPLIRKQLLDKNASLKEKTIFLYTGIEDADRPVSVEEKEKILQQHTGGHEYFVYESEDDAFDNKIMVLKAFSLFKKRLKSSMKLVILDKPGAPLIPDFKNYKYRESVKIISRENDALYRSMRGAAYAAIYLPQAKNKTATALHFLRSAVPLIVSDHEFNHLVYGDAVLYTQMFETHIAENIMAIYKDEELRKTLITKGTALAALYNWEESCRQLAESILPVDRD